MIDELDPISPDEFVYRRIHKNHFKRDKMPCIERVAFQPSPMDTMGLSLFRQKLISAEAVTRLATRKPPEEYCVARLRVSDITELDLTVIVDDPAHPEHVLIPEIKLENAKDDWSRSKQRLLAELASAAVVWQFGSGSMR